MSCTIQLKHIVFTAICATTNLHAHYIIKFLLSNFNLIIHRSHQLYSLKSLNLPSTLPNIFNVLVTFHYIIHSATHQTLSYPDHQQYIYSTFISIFSIMHIIQMLFQNLQCFSFTSNSALLLQFTTLFWTSSH